MALESIDNDPKLRNELGLGYFILFDEFNYSPIVTNYLATQYIKEIFEDKDINLEKLAHKQFKKVEDIDKIGVNNYLINVIIFMICTFTGDLLYNMGELGVESVLLRKEYGRILYAMFLHGDIRHLFNNMMLVFFLGAMLEKEVGHIPYAIIYFLSGLGGNLLSLWSKVVTGNMAGSIGASGAVFGLDGLLLALVLFSGRQMENVSMPRVLVMIAYSLYSGFTGSNIDNAAHVGGLITGFLTGAVCCFLIRRRQSFE